MPIALSPDATVDVSLESEKELPADKRPAFACRFLTVRNHLKVSKLLRDALEASSAHDQAKANALLTESLTVCVAGWRNLGADRGDFAPDKLDDVLTVAEKWELAYAAVRAVQLAESDRKGSASPSGPATVASATVPAASAERPSPAAK